MFIRLLLGVFVSAAIPAVAELSVRVRLVAVPVVGKATASFQIRMAQEALARLREVGVRANIVSIHEFADVVKRNSVALTIHRTYDWERVAGIRPGRNELVLYLLPPMEGAEPRPYLGGVARRTCSVGTRTALAFASLVEGQNDKSRLVILHEVLHLMGALHAMEPSVMSGRAFNLVTDGDTGSFARLPIARESRRQIENCKRAQRNRGVWR